MENQNHVLNKKGKIYKIYHPNSELFYIGCTTKKYLSERLGQHRYDLKRHNKGLYGNIGSFVLFKLENNESKCKIELLEEFNYINKKEIFEKEKNYINLNQNKIVNIR